MRRLKPAPIKRSPRQYGEKKSPQTYEKVLKALRRGLTPWEAAEAAGCARSTIFDWKRDDKAFAAAWEEAIEEGTDHVEAEAHRRAIDGVKRPVYQGGELVGHVQEYSDTLMTLILKGRRPHMYNKERHEHTGKDGGPIATSAAVEVTFVKPKKAE